MPHFELIFVARHLGEAAIDALYDSELDCFVATDFDERHTVTVTGTGSDAVDATKAMLTRLHSLGIEVEFVQHDLVNRAEIAERLGVSRSLVSQWVRGAKGHAPFPAGFSDAAGGIWLWGDVARWRREGGFATLGGLDHPTRAQLDELNDYIRTGCQHSGHRNTGQVLMTMLVANNQSGWDAGAGHPVALKTDRLSLSNR